MAQKMGKIDEPEQPNGKLARLRGLRGVYGLQIEVPMGLRLRVGSLSELSFRPGAYCYVGSAQTGLEKRIARHLQKEKKRFWHIDYLLAQAPVQVVQVYYKEAGKATECRVAQRLSGVFQAVKGFGASDCTCLSHLLYIGSDPQAMEGILRQEWSFNQICLRQI
jgi:Uri superfamily endonuclease